MGKNGGKNGLVSSSNFQFFTVFLEKGGGEGGPPLQQHKFLLSCTPLSSLLLDFLIVRPNKNDALGAKVCFVSSVVVVVVVVL